MKTWKKAGEKLSPRSLTTKAWWDKDAPIHWPVDAAGKPLWKETVAPKPGDPLKTNTHGEHG